MRRFEFEVPGYFLALFATNAPSSAAAVRGVAGDGRVGTGARAGDAALDAVFDEAGWRTQHFSADMLCAVRRGALWRALTARQVPKDDGEVREVAADSVQLVGVRHGDKRSHDAAGFVLRSMQAACCLSQVHCCVCLCFVNCLRAPARERAHARAAALNISIAIGLEAFVLDFGWQDTLPDGAPFDVM